LSAHRAVIFAIAQLSCCLCQVGVQQFYKRRPIAGVAGSHTYLGPSPTTAAAAAAAADINHDKDEDARRYHGNVAPPAAESAHRLQPAHHQYVRVSVRLSVCHNCW